MYHQKGSAVSRGKPVRGYWQDWYHHLASRGKAGRDGRVLLPRRLDSEERAGERDVGVATSEE